MDETVSVFKKDLVLIEYPTTVPSPSMTNVITTQRDTYVLYGLYIGMYRSL